MEKRAAARDRHNMATEYQFAVAEIPLGPWTSYSLINDPKHMSFVLARYKFCAKMLEGKERVIEIGCGDGFGIPVVAQAVRHLHCVDWEERNIAGCQARLKHLRNVTYECIDVNEAPTAVKADAMYSIDVIEHLEPEQEDAFMRNVCYSLDGKGVLITGTPNVTAAQYASERSAVQHVNLKSQKTLKELMSRYFENVFLFGMNDEVVHLGYAPMCHYIWSVAVGLKREYVNV